MAGLRSFFAGELSGPGSEVILDPQEGRHLARVLRARPGEAVELLDGRGRLVQAEFIGEQGKSARLKIVSVEHIQRAGLAITLLQAIPKGKTFDSILRQSAEIGVARIIPLMTERTEVKLGKDRLDSKTEHWQAILREAGKQSGNVWFPELVEASSLKSALAGLNAALCVVASLEDKAAPILTALEVTGAPTNVTLAVGPEGDFSPAEYTLLREAGFRPVRLGHQVLKCDTAALYLLSVIDAWQHTQG